ncbi:hypothetical protein K402DRAFT_163558 [Aulographum hederae CBS 113979]|uniref:Uncharacterized protein n=1 Tax=Aulographum hederae CBS 113979 TaxID=1176131 RepID=A0A6G1GRC7_9PEZI|nr:hypothetical protein K402DRAFT_163558 [Aulographum hederae CBS 113979]
MDWGVFRCFLAHHELDGYGESSEMNGRRRGREVCEGRRAALLRGAIHAKLSHSAVWTIRSMQCRPARLQCCPLHPSFFPTACSLVLSADGNGSPNKVYLHMPTMEGEAFWFGSTGIRGLQVLRGEFTRPAG